MEYSNFNFLFENNNKYYVYNSLSNSTFKLTKDLYDELSNFKKGQIITNNEDFPEEILNQLKKTKVIVNSDKLEKLKLKQNFDKNRFSNEKVYLTIAPTLECNFRCFYCFEKGHLLNYSMSDEVENEICNYLKKINGIKELEICWFGGEPLLSKDRMISLTKKIKKLEINFNSTLITNGYLLDEDFIQDITYLNINKIQITIDGLEKTHNKRRPHFQNKKSFHVIINNLIKLVDLLNTNKIKIIISIRVNLDKTNIDEYKQLYIYLNSKIKYQFLEICPGWVTHVADRKIKPYCMKKKDIYEFIKKHKKFKEILNTTYPSNTLSDCFARTYWSIVIAPNGDCYKCWEDLGNEDSKLGNIKDYDLLNSEIQLKYLYDTFPFDNNDCKKCNILPICSNCPKDFLESNGKNKCSMYKGRIQEYLKQYISSL